MAARAGAPVRARCVECGSKLLAVPDQRGFAGKLYWAVSCAAIADCGLAGTNLLGSERGGRQQTQSRKIGSSRAESTGERQRAEKRDSRIKINKRLPLEAVSVRSSSNTKFRSGAVGDSERWVSKEQQSFMGNKRETCSTDKCLREHPSD